jgi:4-diphosphocytidyl-2C-methyl-D-erythritol kinase
MSGSGSAVFAVYRSAEVRDDALMTLGRKFGDVVAVVVGGG